MSGLTQRVRVGATYANGVELFEVVEVSDVGTVTLLDDDGNDRTVGINAFRRSYWLIKPAPAALGVRSDTEGDAADG